MAPRPALIDVQALDLERDALLVRRAELPERETLRGLAARAVELDQGHAQCLEERAAVNRQERDWANQVEDLAVKAQELEDKLYSGTVKATKELEALQEEVRGTRERQSEFESSQMETLEEIDRLDAEAVDNRKAREQVDTDVSTTQEALAQAEALIDGELAVLADRCELHRQDVPPTILTEYDRLRGKERLGGRAAAELEGGTCGACRVRLPVIEYNRIRNEADDVLAHCPRCSRVLIRLRPEVGSIEGAP